MTRSLATALLALTLASCSSDDCATGVRCAAPVEVACTGPTTMTRVPAPARDEACAVTSDTPAAGFVVGGTDVHFRAANGATCITRVTVTDRDAPTLSCANLPRVLRMARDAMTATPVPTATDLCTEHVTVTAAPPSVADHGTLPVTFTATDSTGNHANCSAMLDVRNAYAPTGLRVIHAELADESTAITLVWDHASDSDATGYRVERASSIMGPWTSVARVTTASTRYVESSLPDTHAFYRVVTLVDSADGAATDPVRALAIAATSYDLGVQPVPDLNLPANTAARTPATQSAPLHAIVRHPVELASGPFPLVLMLHGNHGNCRLGSYDRSGTDPNRDDACTVTNTGMCRTGTPTPNAEGNLYLAETLAAHGYIVATVDANVINCRDGTRSGRADGYIGQRAKLLVEHMRRWRTWNAGTGADPFGDSFVGHVDMARVGLFGHSRGAEAVAAVPSTAAAATDVDGITVASVFSLAPTNFDNPQPGAVPYATLVPVCDGDVFTYNGVQLYDNTLLNADDAAPAAQLFMRHANHDYFNTEWRFDDNASGIPSCTEGEIPEPAVQQRVLEGTVAAWFDGTLPANATLEPWLRAAGDVPPGINLHAAGPDLVDIRRSYSAPHLTRVDDFTHADPAHNLLGGAYEPTGGFADMTPLACTGTSSPACDRAYSISSPQGPIRFNWPHDNPFRTSPHRGALAIDWSAGDATLAVDLGVGSNDTYDASMARVLSLRVASRQQRLNPLDRPDQDFEVRIVDGAGHHASARASEVTVVPHLYPSDYPRAVLQTVRFTLAGLSARSTPPVDLRTLRRVEIALSAENRSTGSLLVSDIEFAD